MKEVRESGVCDRGDVNYNITTLCQSFNAYRATIFGKVEKLIKKPVWLALMLVEIFTPEALLFKGEVTSVKVPGAKGPFVILNHHAPIISLLTEGEVKLFEGKKELQHFTITGGTLECNQNKVVILAD